MAFAWSLLLPGMVAVMMSVVTGEMWAWTGARRRVPSEDRPQYRRSMRLRAWFLAPPAFAAFWIFEGGQLIGIPEMPRVVGFFVLWLGGGNLMLLLANRVPSIRKFTDPSAAGVDSLINREPLAK